MSCGSSAPLDNALSVQTVLQLKNNSVQHINLLLLAPLHDFKVDRRSFINRYTVSVSAHMNDGCPTGICFQHSHPIQYVFIKALVRCIFVREDVEIHMFVSSSASSSASLQSFARAVSCAVSKNL